MKVKNILDLIGNTPLIELKEIKKKYNLKANIYAKLESYNPFGSIKDRAVLQMINDLFLNNKVKEGSLIIEPTSGNTGIALAAIGKIKKLKVIIVMPENMSKERIDLIKKYGAEVILTDASLGMKGAISKVNELLKIHQDSIMLDQFNNPSNALAHYLTTGKEIYLDLNGKVDIFVAGIGTGGTITGTSKYLKEQNKNVKVVAVEPFSSPLISKGFFGAHKIQGIGANFIPKNYDKNVVDEVITAPNEDAFDASRLVAKKEGVLVGISSGAALISAINIAKRSENAGKNIVVIFPDDGGRYLSTDLYDE